MNFFKRDFGTFGKLSKSIDIREEALRLTENGIPLSEGWSTLKTNVGSRLQYETIEHIRRKYQDPLIAGAYHDYWGNYSRKEVCLSDAIGERITRGFMEIILMKYPKFTMNDEVQTEYILEDVRQAIQFLNLKEPLIEIGTNCIISGWCLLLWLLETNNKKKEEEEKKEEEKEEKEEKIEEFQLVPKIFGWDECHPRFWTRFTQIEQANKIYKYKAYYIPYPNGREAAHYGMKQERYIMYPSQANFQHLTRSSFNRGHGFARIQPIWDAITKLRERSDSEHFRSSNFMEARYPKAYHATGQAKEFIEKVRKTDRTTGIAIEEYINPKTGLPTGLPNVTFRPWSQGASGAPFDTNKAASFMDNEWARLLCNLGYSQVWAVGTQAGQETGSEINLTRDDRADIAEFSLFVPIMKKVLKKLCELGIFDLLDISTQSKELLLNEQYQIVSWKTWEYNDKMALQVAQLEHQLETKRGESDERNDYDQEKENAIAPYVLINTKTNASIYGYKTNINYPMTPAFSSTVKGKGVFESDFLVQFHEGQGTYRYHFPSNEEAEEAYHEMSEESPGGFVWDKLRGHKIGPAYFSGKPTPGGTTASLVPYDIGGRTPVGRMPEYEEKAKEMREYKIKGEPPEIIGAGITREPMKFGVPKKKEKIDVWDVTATTPSYFEQKEKEEPWEMPLRYYNPTKIRAQALPPLFKLSRKKFNEAAQKLGVDTFGSRSIDKVKELVKKVEEYRTNHQIRYNSISMGNPMAFGIPLYYDIDGKISEEYPCLKEWKKIENHAGNLWLYDDLGHEGERIIVGTYEYFGWNEEKDLPEVKFDYDEKLIRQKIGNSNNEIIKRLDAGLEPEMSTEYYCKTINHEGKTWQMDFRDADGRPRFDGIAIVEFGNCPSGHCNFERLNEWRTNPFAGYKDFDDCVSKNQDKKDPEAYCATIKRKVADDSMLTEDEKALVKIGR